MGRSSTDELMFPPQHIVMLHMHMKADENVSFPIDFLYLIYPATIAKKNLCFAWHEEFQIQEKCGGVG
jgi:hypothetical protein